MDILYEMRVSGSITEDFWRLPINDSWIREQINFISSLSSLAGNFRKKGYFREDSQVSEWVCMFTSVASSLHQGVFSLATSPRVGVFLNITSLRKFFGHFLGGTPPSILNSRAPPVVEPTQGEPEQIRYSCDQMKPAGIQTSESGNTANILRELDI